MVKVKIPEWFGTGNLQVTINGKAVAVPIGKETYVDENSAAIIERIVEERKKKEETQEELRKKQREAIGAASEEEVEEMRKMIEAMQGNVITAENGNEVSY